MSEDARHSVSAEAAEISRMVDMMKDLTIDQLAQKGQHAVWVLHAAIRHLGPYLSPEETESLTGPLEEIAASWSKIRRQRPFFGDSSTDQDPAHRSPPE